MKEQFIIYVLRLEDDFYYVGLTQSLNKRFNQHLSGKGSEWTKLHKPIEIIEKYFTEAFDVVEARKIEDYFTRKYMDKYGFEKVRGGHFSHTSDLETFKNLTRNSLFLEKAKKSPEIQLRKYLVFVLELENNKFFIGKAYNLKRAVKNHEKGKASKWTSIHKPLKIVETSEGIAEDKVHDFINFLTEKYMAEKGWYNVRGGSYISLEETALKRTLEKRNKLHITRVLD